MVGVAITLEVVANEGVVEQHDIESLHQKVCLTGRISGTSSNDQNRIVKYS